MLMVKVIIVRWMTQLYVNCKRHHHHQSSSTSSGLLRQNNTEHKAIRGVNRL